MNLTIIGCGYVGTAVASYWHQNHDPSITVTTTTKERVAKLEEVASRVVVMKGSETKAMRSLLQNQHVVLISVAPISDRQVDAETYAQTYLPTATNVVAALKDAPSVQQLIYLSSCSVYGDSDGAWVDESSPVAPVNLRGKVLCEAEEILLQASSDNLRVSILRLGGIYGPGRNLEWRCGLIAGKTFPGNGTNFINWIHLDDIVSAVEFVCQNQCQGIYNLTDNTKLTSRELYKQLCDRYDRPQVVWDASQTNPPISNARVCNKKIQAAGYKLIHPQIII